MNNHSNYLKQTFNIIPLPCAILKPNKPNFTILNINPAFLNICNQNNQTLIGNSFFKIFNTDTYHATTINSISEAIIKTADTLNAQSIGELKISFKTQSGKSAETKYWSLECTPILNPNQTLDTILVTVKDCTEQILKTEKEKPKQQNSQQLQYILNNISNPNNVGTWELNLETNELTLSDDFYRICGFTPHEFAPTFENTTQLIHPEDREKAIKAYTHAIENITNYRIEKKIIQQNGDIITVLSTGVVSKNEAGKATLMTGIFENITGTKQLEQLLRNTIHTLSERNEFIEQIIKNVPIGIAVNKIDDGSAIMLNNKFSEIYGWNESDLIDTPSFFEKVYPDETYRRTISEKVIGDIQTGDATKMHWNNITITTNTGETRIINAKNIPLFDQNMMISTVIDVTETAKQTEEIQRLTQNNEAIINSTDDVIFSIDKNYTLVTVNKAYQTLLKNLVGRDENKGDVVLTGMLGQAVTHKWKSYFERAFTGEKFAINEAIFNPILNKTQYGLVNFNPVLNSKGEIETVACFAKDVTKTTENYLQLQQTKSELDKILDASLDVICIVNKDNNFVKVSAASEKVWGYKPEELVGHSIFEFLHPDYIIQTANSIKKIMQGYETRNFENKYIKKNGAVVVIEWSARWDEHEQLRYGVARDITEKRKNEQAIVDSEAKYKNLFENSPLPMFIWDFKTLQILNCNTEALLLYGYTKAEFLNLSIKDIRPAEDIKLIVEATKSEEVYGKIHKQLWRHKKKNGELIDVDIHSHILNYEGKKAALVLINDVTKKLATEVAIKRTSERYEYVIKATSDAIWDWDLENNKLVWGDGVNTLFGYNLADTQGKDIAHHNNLIHPDDKEKIHASLLNIIASKFNNWEEQYRFKKADGSYAYITDKGIIIRNEIGKPIRIVGAKKDITLNRYYNELEKLERNILAYRQIDEQNVVETLTNYMIGIEALHPGAMCSISEKKENKLFTIAAPSLPAEYIKLTNGIAIGNNIGACNTANFLKEKVIVSDIQNDAHWANIKHLVTEFNLAACWSYPIISQKNEAIGTFAIYHKEKKAPTLLEENTINRVVNIIEIIIENANRTKALEESNLRYTFVTKATSDAIYDWNLADDSVYWGDVFFKNFGWNLQKLNAKKNFCFDRIHPDDKNDLLASLYNAINGNKIITWQGEYRFLKADDSYAHVVDKAYIIRNGDGKAIRVVGSKRDVTERKQEIIRLKLLESVITNTNDIVVITEAEAYNNAEPIIIYVNNAFTQITGYLPEEAIGKTQKILYGPKTSNEDLEILKKHIANLQPCEITLLNYTKTGDEYWVNINLNPVFDEHAKITHWVWLQRDVTDKKQQEINMMKAVIKTQEDERYEVGGELHDNVCQILTSSLITLKMVKKVLPDTEIERFNQGINYITLASNEIRNLSHRLAPAFFNDTSLEEALNNLISNFNIENKYSIFATFDQQLNDLQTKRDFKLNLYRIVQEQLKNIHKYAEATIISINGNITNNNVVLTIKDNGIGFNVNMIKKGIGIANMKRRAELFSGKVMLQSSVGHGCTIQIEIPISEVY